MLAILLLLNFQLTQQHFSLYFDHQNKTFVIINETTQMLIISQ